MTHWAEKYLGEPWSQECDCFGWFRIIQDKEFGRHIEDMDRTGCDLTRFAAHILSSDIPQNHYGWRKTNEPVDGDAVFLARNIKPHHIGIVAIIDNNIHVVHAPEYRGIMIADLRSLRLDGWKIDSYWTPKL